MAPPVFFADIDKPLTDLLADNFHGDKIKFNVKSTAENGTRMELKNVRAPSGAITSELNFGRLFKCSDSAIDYDVSAKMDLTGKLSSTTVISNVADGLKIEFTGNVNANLNKHADQSLVAALKYRNDNLSLLSKLERQRLGKTTATATLMTAYENFGFGGEVVFSNSPGESGKPSANKLTYAVGTSYSFSDATFTIKSTENFNKMSVGYFHRVANNLTAGAELKHTLGADKDALALSLSTLHKLDNTSFFKTKFSSNGVLGFAYTSKMCDHLKVGVSADFSAVDMSKGINVGAAFNYE